MLMNGGRGGKACEPLLLETEVSWRSEETGVKLISGVVLQMGRMITVSVGAFLLILVGSEVTPWTVLDKKVSSRVCGKTLPNLAITELTPSADSVSRRSLTRTSGASGAVVTARSEIPFAIDTQDPPRHLDGSACLFGSCCSCASFGFGAGTLGEKGSALRPLQ